MTIEILKYSVDNKLRVKMKGDALPLHAANQNENPIVYVQHDESRNWATDLQFWVVRTGDLVKLPDNAQYVGTIMLAGGRYVLHVFCVKEIHPR